MKVRTILFFILAITFSATFYAQKGKTDSLKMILTCPFEHGSGREPKEAFSWDLTDKKVIMISNVDSVIRSATNGTVTNMDPVENNLYEIVINYGDYYFWYYGVAKSFVVRGNTVKAGQPIGRYIFGTELEFRMFKFDDPVDPRDLLECKIPKMQ